MNGTAASSTVVRTGGLGDLVLLHPALKALHERDGGAPSLVTSSGLIPQVYAHCPFVDEVHVVRAKRMPRVFNRSWHALNRLAERPMRTLFLLDPDPRTAGFYGRLERAAEEVVSCRDLPPRGEAEHESAYVLRLTGGGAEPFPEARPELPVTEDELARAADWLTARGAGAGRRVLLQAGNKATMKRGPAARAANLKYWPEERWVQVINAATDGEDCAVLLCGSPPERDWLEVIRAGCRRPERVWNVAADMPIRRFMALSRLPGSFYLGVDTGPAHVAAAMGCPACILFGPSSPANFLPLSWGQLVIPLEKAGAPGGRPQIGLLEAEEVIAAMRRLLATGTVPGDPEWNAATLVPRGTAPRGQ